MTTRRRGATVSSGAAISWETVSGEWELGAASGRLVLSRGGSTEPPEIPTELRASLTEWARVAGASAARDGTAGRLVADRGRRLALRVADTTRIPVRYIDPVHGRHEVIPPTPTPTPEPTPWATGLIISLTAAIVMVFALATLSEGLATVGVGLAVVGNVVIAIGLAPSLWLLKDLPTWRWIGYGAIAGIVAAWIGMIAALPA